MDVRKPTLLAAVSLLSVFRAGSARACGVDSCTGKVLRVYERPMFTSHSRKRPS
jgi:hypothetical protein